MPPSWATATPAIRLASSALPATSVAAAAVPGFPSGLVNEATLDSLAGGCAGRPGGARRQLDRHPRPHHHRRASHGSGQARPHHRPAAGDARTSAALERRRGQPR
ncbi:hypothetical protein [Mycobacterium montefiorense]|uniref:hypothetical protein n=1 Tax=Mycobacterium montefiorense TaxID=154654 RepID=UPI0021F264B7